APGHSERSEESRLLTWHDTSEQVRFFAFATIKFTNLVIDPAPSQKDMLEHCERNNDELHWRVVSF
ncbi:MAG: hypothetical protein Q8O86_12510, partial [Dehalococcoidia bacterium]|nr:hypothetical protein [Dehalococcoidia bacterium]